MCYIDTSAMGLGKTFIVLALAQMVDYPIGVVAPAGLVGQWEAYCEQYKIKLHFCLSYETLRSQKNKQPKHGLLDRKDTKTASGTITTFSPTPLLQNYIKNGMFVVFDESQKIKNNSSQYKACRCIANTIHDMGGLSRFAVISATPFDKEEHVINMLRFIGYINHPKLHQYNRHTRTLKLLGAQELIDICESFDQNATERVLNNTPYDHKSVASLCFTLYRDVIQRHIVSAMPNPTENKDIRNGYYNISKKESLHLSKLIGRLSDHAQYQDEYTELDSAKINYGAIMSTLADIESCKIGIYERLVREKLEENSNNKVIVFLNYLAPIAALSQALKAYKPLVMTGETPMRKRDEIRAKFQESNSESRLLIANIKVAGVGMDLDDQHGKYQRYVFMSPCYIVQDIHQATGRVYRAHTKSTARIRMVYGKCESGKRETSILNALARKSLVMRQTLQQQVNDGVVFPGDYLDEIEPDN
jgi:hypothetical protein